MHMKITRMTLLSAALGTLIALVLIIAMSWMCDLIPTAEAVTVIEPTPTPEVYDGLIDHAEVVEPTPTPEYVIQDPTKALEYGYPAYTDEDVEVLAKVVWAEARGLSKMEQAAVIWCILNRVDDTENDYWPNTIIEVATQPNQFAYSRHNPVKDEFVELAVDVLDRWEAEKHGCIMPGRVLPKEYTFFFSRDADENLFRTTYECHEVFWDWSLPNPYK